MFKKIIVAFICLFLSSCIKKQPLKVGTFYLYEKDSLVSQIYRLNDYQVEESDGEILYARLNWKSDTSVIIGGINNKINSIDTITFLMTHNEVEKNKYKIIGTPTDKRINYRYEGVLVKETSMIKDKYFDILVKLNTNEDVIK